MKYLLEFNPWKDKLSDKEITNLTDFCEGYLAYLLDEGFNLSIGRNNNLSGNQFGKTKVTITKGKTPKRIDFTWEDISDYLIPLFIGLSKSYDIEKISFLTIKDRFDIRIDDTIVDDNMIGYINRTIQDKKIGYIDIIIKSIKSNQLELPLTEGLEPTEKDKEIKEYCEEALSYLIDDGFQVNYFKSEYKYLDSLTRIIITNKNGDFNWERIEDYLPPLLTSLDREYGIKSNTIKLLYHPYKEITLKIKDILKGDFNTNQMLCSVYFDVKNKNNKI